MGSALAIEYPIIANDGNCFVIESVGKGEPIVNVYTCGKETEPVKEEPVKREVVEEEIVVVEEEPLDCAVGETGCDGVCVNLQIDTNNCGECANICGNEEFCYRGKCTVGITQCGEPSGGWVERKNYLLLNDLTIVSGIINCLSLEADDVTLDCNGFNINRVSETHSTIGVFVSQRSNVIVRNCTMNNLHNGIQLINANNNNVLDNNIKNTDNAILSMSGSSFNIFQNNLLENSDRGFQFTSNSNNNELVGNVVLNSDNYDLFIASSSANQIRNNLFDGGHAIRLIGSTDNFFSANVVNNSHVNAVYLYDGSERNTFENNYLIGSSDHGVSLRQSFSNTFTDNTVKNNNLGGLNIVNSDGNTFSNNVICDNLQDDLSCIGTGNGGDGNYFNSVRNCDDGWPQLNVHYSLCLELGAEEEEMMVVGGGEIVVEEETIEEPVEEEYSEEELIEEEVPVEEEEIYGPEEEYVEETIKVEEEEIIEETVELAGDINNDDTVNIIDAQQVIITIMNDGCDPFDESNERCLNADVNCDCRVNILDASLIINKIIGRDVTLGCGESGRSCPQK